MIEEKKITIDGMAFSLRPIKPLKALVLDKQVMALLVPILGGFKGGDSKKSVLDAQLDMGAIAEGITKALSSLNDSDTTKLVVDLFYGVIYFDKSGKAIEIDATNIDSIFADDFSIIYKLMFEVMKHNKFSPFKLVGGGSLTNLISGLTDTKKAGTPTGRKSVK